MVIQKEDAISLVGVGEILIEHGLEHYEKFKSTFSKTQESPHLVLEGTTDNPMLVIRRPEELSFEDRINLVISIIHFDNAAELYLKSFLVLKGLIINLPKKVGIKFTDTVNSILSDKTLDFSDVLNLSKNFIANGKTGEFFKGLKEMHDIRNELYHIGGMGKPFTIHPTLFKSFIKSLKILFQIENCYQNDDSKPLVEKWEKSLNSDWIV